MQEFLKKNALVIIAFAVPLVFVGIVFLFAVLPSMFLKSHYNFVYAVCEGSSWSNCEDYLQTKYTVENGRLRILENPSYFSSEREWSGLEQRYVESQRLLYYEKEGKLSSRLFLYDAEKNESRELTREEALGVRLSGLATSPEGILVEAGYSDDVDFFLFDSSSSKKIFLKKGKSRKSISVAGQTGRYYDPSNFHFVGWVVQ